MSVETAIPANQKKFVNRVITAPLGPVGRYHLKKILLLSSVTLICGIVLLLLLLVFSKLNLYYLESNGFPVDEELRDAYYSQVQTEAMGVGGFLLLQQIGRSTRLNSSHSQQSRMPSSA